MTDLVTYGIPVIIVWRLTHLISAEDGPFDIIIKLRKRAGNGFFGKLMDCFYCLSIWIGIAAALYVTRQWDQVIILCLYYSGAAILLEKLTNKNFV
ncbi:MAG: DUF1360 domain-containing protein [Bacteroidetes bacterium]|nr:DUF1360 domain-containing protein [Bacteroidota bacterium]